MKKLFQCWLLLFVGLAFSVTLFVSWEIHSELARESALEILHLKLNDAKRQLRRERNGLNTIRSMTNDAALAKARACARILSSEPSVLVKPGELEKIRKVLDVDELHVFNGKGVPVAGVPALRSKYAPDELEKPSSLFFGRDHALIQPARPNNGFLNYFLQYAVVPRTDASGAVRIGYRPERLENAMRLADVRTIAAMFRIGSNGTIRIEKNDGTLSGNSERVFRAAVNGRPSLCLSQTDGDYILTGSLPEEEMYLSRDSVIRILVVGYLILFGIIFLLISALLQRVVIKGIYSVNDSLEKITAGRLDEKIDVHTTAEFNILSRGINETVDALKKAIEAEAKRIDAELETGRTIQMSVLPTDFPDTAQYSVLAAMYPAREVGGDFYDVFPVSGGTYEAVLIADVSGKGISAALYMMTAKTLLKEMIQSGGDPAEAFALANRELCRSNKANMFLSVFLAILNVKTGVLQCVSAGHNPPLLKHENGVWEYLRIKHSLVLGCSPKARYQSVPVTLRPGDRLLLYTDGVTEAMNPQKELFGEKRFREFCDSFCGTDAEFLPGIRKELEKFASGEPQSDDITMLTLVFRG